MNSIRVWFVSVVLLCLGPLGYAQDAGQQPEKNNPQETRQPEREVKPPHGEQPQETAPNPDKQEKPKSSKEQTKPNHEEQASGGGHQQQANVKGKGTHIPDPKFKANFGRQHTFVVKQVITQTTVVPQQTQFVVAGYTFVFLDPWPSDWLLTDDCYIDFLDDEYFLVDIAHPGVRVALFVVG